jgi:hypothetical protein
VAVASASKLICELPDSSTIFLCGSTNSGFALEQSDVDLMVVVGSDSISGIAEHRTEIAGNIIVSVRTVMLTTNNILSLADLCRLSESCCLVGSRPRLSADIVDHALQELTKNRLDELYKEDSCYIFAKKKGCWQSSDLKFGIGGIFDIEILLIYARWAKIIGVIDDECYRKNSKCLRAYRTIIETMKVYTAEVLGKPIANRAALVGMNMPWFFSANAIEGLSFAVREPVLACIGIE